MVSLRGVDDVRLRQCSKCYPNFPFFVGVASDTITIYYTNQKKGQEVSSYMVDIRLSDSNGGSWIA